MSQREWGGPMFGRHSAEARPAPSICFACRTVADCDGVICDPVRAEREAAAEARDAYVRSGQGARDAIAALDRISNETRDLLRRLDAMGI